MLVFRTTRKLTRPVARGLNRRDLQVVFTSLDDNAVCICFCTGTTPSVCAVFVEWWRVLSHPTGCGCFRCVVRKKKRAASSHGVCTALTLFRLGECFCLCRSLFIFCRAVVSFFCFGEEKKLLCGDFGRDITALVRF